MARKHKNSKDDDDEWVPAFLAALKSRPEIWKIGHPDLNNTAVRNQAWQEISLKVKQASGVDKTVDQLKKQWENAKSQNRKWRRGEIRKSIYGESMEFFAIVNNVNSSDPQVRLVAVQQIRVLLSSDTTSLIDELIQASVVSDLVECLEANDNPPVQSEATCVLTEIASRSPEHTQVIVNAGVVPLSLLFVDDSRIVQVVLSGLRNRLQMAGDGVEAMCQFIKECNDLDKMRQLQNHNDPNVCQLAFEIIDGYFPAVPSASEHHVSAPGCQADANLDGNQGLTVASSTSQKENSPNKDISSQRPNDGAGGSVSNSVSLFSPSQHASDDVSQVTRLDEEIQLDPVVNEYVNGQLNVNHSAESWPENSDDTSLDNPSGSSPAPKRRRFQSPVSQQQQPIGQTPMSELQPTALQQQPPQQSFMDNAADANLDSNQGPTVASSTSQNDNSPNEDISSQRPNDGAAESRSEPRSSRSKKRSKPFVYRRRRNRAFKRRSIRARSVVPKKKLKLDRGRCQNEGCREREAAALEQVPRTDIAGAEDDQSFELESDGRQKPYDFESNQYYDNFSNPKGLALVINIETFHPEVRGDFFNRKGSDKDYESMKTLFQHLDYEVTDRKDLTAEQIINEINAFAAKFDTKSAYSSCVVVLMTHGENGKFVGADGKWVDQESVFRPIAECPGLVAKPKIFIIQGCRGNLINKGTPIPAPDRSGTPKTAADSRGTPMMASDSRRTPITASDSKGFEAILEADWCALKAVQESVEKIPVGADTCVLYSTPPGYLAWRNIDSGSWFIQAIYEEFKNHAHEPWADLLTLAVRVTKRVATDTKYQRPYLQLPHTEFNMLKKFHFFPDLARNYLKLPTNHIQLDRDKKAPIEVAGESLQALAQTNATDRKVVARYISSPFSISPNFDDFKRQPMDGDGNCLFRALAFFVYGDPERHQSTRSEIYNFYTSLDQSQRQQLQDRYAFDPQQRAEVMKNPPTWGGDEEIAAAATMLQSPVYLFRRSNVGVMELHEFIPAFIPVFNMTLEWDIRCPLARRVVLMCTTSTGGHFDAMIPAESQESSAPPPKPKSDTDIISENLQPNSTERICSIISNELTNLRRIDSEQEKQCRAQLLAVLMKFKEIRLDED